MGAGTFRSVLRWTLVLAAVAFLMLLVSGLYLFWNYRPGEALWWSGVQGSRPDSWAFRLRDVHRWSGVLFVALALVTAFAAVVLAVQLRRVSPSAIGVGFFVFAFAASITGNLLPWDQVALEAVTVGTDLKGYDYIISGSARYLLVDGAEISADTFLRWFWTHIAVLPVVLIGLALLILLSARTDAET